MENGERALLWKFRISSQDQRSQTVLWLYPQPIRRTYLSVTDGSFRWIKQVHSPAGLYKYKGNPPYRNLLSVHVAKAKKLLKQGVTPAAAIQTGFSDQSHFTNTFHTFIGRVPGMYQDIFEKVSEKKWILKMKNVSWLSTKIYPPA